MSQIILFDNYISKLVDLSIMNHNRKIKLTFEYNGLFNRRNYKWFHQYHVFLGLKGGTCMILFHMVLIWHKIHGLFTHEFLTGPH